MRNATISLGFRAVAAVLVLLLTTVSTVFAQATTGTITGAVTSASGTPVAAARISITGPTFATASSGDDGTFSISLPPGVYKLTVDRGGYQSVSLSDITVVAGAAQPLTVTLSQASLESLRTIGSVTATTTGRSAINTGPATQSYIPASAFADAAKPQINDVLQQIPDVNIQHMGTQLDTSITIGGLQPYETQVLIDGRPVALGQYGVWYSQYYPSFLVGGAEVETGPGNTTQFANVAVGGTVNFTTPPFTSKPTASFTTGGDSYYSFYNNLTASGKLGRTSYVIAGGESYNNFPYSTKSACDLYFTDFATAPNSPTSAGIVPFCDQIGGSLLTRAQLYKLKYDFSDSTSFQASFIGSYGGYAPQGFYSGLSYGPTLVEQCLPNTLQCTSPADQGLVGKTINGIFWYPGTIVTNAQQLYSAEFRTTIGSNTLLLRPYIANIQPETYNGTPEGTFPAFYGPSASMGAPCASTMPSTTCYPGPQTVPPGTQVPATGPPAPNAFENICPQNSIYDFYLINSPTNTITTTGSGANAQEECYQYPFSVNELDQLYGNTLTFIHPFGDNSLTFNYDFHGQSTFAFFNAPTLFTVPQGSTTRFTTFSLTGDFHPARNLTIDAGLYDTLWTASGSQPLVDPSTQTVTLVGLQRTVDRFDPHLAIVFRPQTNTSFRAAFGTSETFPFIGEMSGPASIVPPNFPYTAGVVTQKNPNLLPERSIAYDLGVDHRFSNGAVFSMDLLDTVVHNVFQSLTTTQNVMYLGGPAVLGIIAPVNVALLQSQILTARYAFAPRFGLGYNFSLAADSSMLQGIPASAFGAAPSIPADNVQLCGTGLFTPGLATCIPYLKGYGQFTYTWHNGTYVGVGVDFEGKNNEYYQPPFAMVDLTLRHPISKSLELQISVQNLFNNNTFSNLPEPGLGVPLTGESSADGVTTQQGTYSSYLLPAPARTARLQLRFHTGS